MKNERIQNMIAGDPVENVAVSGTPDWQKDVPVDNGAIVSKGLIFVFGFLLVFFVWSIAFPIASAVIAPGKIISSGQNKLIQHASGGIVRKILVRDGDVVEKDAVLMVLDGADSTAQYSRLIARRSMLNGLKQRLDAESSGAVAVNPPPSSGLVLRGSGSELVTVNSDGEAELSTSEQETAQRIAQEQLKEFNAGRNRLSAEIEAANAQRQSLKEQASGLKRRLTGARDLLDFTESDIARVTPLVEEGYLAKNRLWELNKTRLEQMTEIGRLETELASVDQRVREADARVAQLSESDQEKRSEELTRVISELAEIKDQLIAARGAVEQTELRAPTSGTIVNLALHTEGGVAEPGKVLAEIVPLSGELVSEFRIGLADIKSVAVGNKARIVITAFNRRTYDPIDGEISYVSADSTVDPQTGEAYFLARAKMVVSPGNRAAVSEVQAGMATEVYALSTPRTFMNYMLQPITDSFGKAFREAN